MQVQPKAADGRSLPETWGDWLNGYDWSHWATLTFAPYQRPSKPGLGPPKDDATKNKPGPPPDYAHRAFNRFISGLSCRSGQGVWWFRGDEFGERLGRLHLHSVIGGADRVPPEALARAWRDGFAQVERFDPEKGAAHYVTKYVTKGLADYEVGGAW